MKVCQMFAGLLFFGCIALIPLNARAQGCGEAAAEESLDCSTCGGSSGLSQSTCQGPGSGNPGDVCFESFGACCDIQYALANTRSCPNCGGDGPLLPGQPRGRFSKLNLRSDVSGPLGENLKPVALLALAAPLPPLKTFPDLPPSSNDIEFPPATELHVTAAKTQFTGDTIFSGAKCDAQNNLYVRPYTNERVKNHTLPQGPIQKIRPDGSLGESFNVTDSMLPNVAVQSFFAAPEGKVYVSAFANPGKPGIYILEFSSDGVFKAKTRVDTEWFSIQKLAVFKSGEFLLSGVGGERQNTPMTAVFDANGKLIKKVSAPEDEEFGRRAAAGDVRFLPEFPGDRDNKAVLLGQAVAGSDGNVYLLRSASSAVIYAIAPNGEIVRAIHLESGSSGLIAHGMASAPGRLAVTFDEDHMPGVMIQVVDLEGNPLALYRSRPPEGPVSHLGCYVPPAFRFFGWSDAKGGWSIGLAEPK